MRSKGLSLLEALVTLGVTSLIMSFMAVTVSYAYQRFRHSSQRSDRQQQLLICVQRLGIDLRRAPAGSVSAYYPSGGPAGGDLAISMLSPMTEDGAYQRNAGGELLYQAYLTYYRHSPEGQICWVRTPLTSPTSVAVAQTPSETAATLSLPRARRLVTGPLEFRLLDSGGLPTDVVNDPVRLQVILGGVTGPGQLPFTFVVDPPG